MKPSPEQMRVAIAEALGWTVINGIICDPRPAVRNGVQSGDVDMNPVSDLPNYPESLDACAEFEATLDPLGREQYVDSLATVVNDSFAIDTYEAHWNMLHATALQRCEAFLKCKEIKT